MGKGFQVGDKVIINLERDSDNGKEGVVESFVNDGTLINVRVNGVLLEHLVPKHLKPVLPVEEKDECQCKKENLIHYSDIWAKCLCFNCVGCKCSKKEIDDLFYPAEAMEDIYKNSYCWYWQSMATGKYYVRMVCSGVEPKLGERMCYSGEFSFKKGEIVKVLLNSHLAPLQKNAIESKCGHTGLLYLSKKVGGYICHPCGEKIDEAINLLKEKGIIKDGQIINLS